MSEGYAERDAKLSERRRFYFSQLERYPLLEDVMHGRKNFLDSLHWLHLEFTVMQPLPFERFLDGEGYHKLSRADPFMEKFTPFAEMVYALTEDVSITIDNDLLVGALSGKVVPSKIEGMENRLNTLFYNLAAYSERLDRDVRRHFMDILLQENPEVFRDEYRRMNADEREYAEYTLSRMLGAGILRVDEIELEKIVWDARELAREKDDGTE